MKQNNSLDTPVFQDELDFKTLENILECLDHVTPKKVSRSEYVAMQWNFLVETWEDKFGKSYDLYLPEDLVHWELLHLIDFLSRKFWLEDYTPYWRIITKTKVMIWMILRWVWVDEWEKYLQELAEKYSLSPEFITRLQSQKEGWDKMSFSQAKEMIKSVKSRRKKDNYWKVWENEDDIVLWFDELKELYGEEFDLTFFRKWVNMLRLGIMTITQAEQKALKRRGVWKWEKISFHVSDDILDEQERLLRDKIWIEELKQELREARKSWNQEKVNEVELKATNRILEILYEYPYQDTENNYWYQPNKIAEFKEIYCVWFSLLWHAFLSELWIRHNWLNWLWHSALEIFIWESKYLFDPSENKQLYKIYNNIKYVYIWEAKKVLLSQIYTNNWNGLFKSWIYKEAIKVYNKAIKLNPENTEAYNNKWSAQEYLWNSNDAIEMYNVALDINPYYNEAYKNKWLSLCNLWSNKSWLRYIYVYFMLNWTTNDTFESIYKNEKAQIKQLIDSQNFEWLRLYLLELEKQDN